MPVKPYAESKTRLASCLSHQQRIFLSQYLLLNTLKAARPLFDQVVVVSRDTQVLEDAHRIGAVGLLESSPGLNPALDQAIEWVSSTGNNGIVILPSDLPLLTQADLEILLTRSNQSPIVVISPCRRGTGTNALLIHPPQLIQAAFGDNSFGAHCAAAQAVGVEPEIHSSYNISFDLDTPQDWQLWRSQDRRSNWAQVCSQFDGQCPTFDI